MTMQATATRPVFDEAFERALAAAGVDSDGIAALELTYEQDPDGFWSKDDVALEAEVDGFTRMTAYTVRRVMLDYYEQVGTVEAASAALPERPPYLRFSEDGECQNYDPGDPTQVYIDENGKTWRWVPNALPSLRWRQVVDIAHMGDGEVQVPDDQDAIRAAIAGGFDWFLKGFGSYRGWITRGGKVTFDYTQADRIRYMAVLEQYRGGALPAGAIG